MSGVVVSGSATSPDAQFFVLVDPQFPTRRRAIPSEIPLRNVKGPESDARNELIVGNGGASRVGNSGFFPWAIAHNRYSERDHAVSRAIMMIVLRLLSLPPISSFEHDAYGSATCCTK